MRFLHIGDICAFVMDFQSSFLLIIILSSPTSFRRLRTVQVNCILYHMRNITTIRCITTQYCHRIYSVLTVSNIIVLIAIDEIVGYIIVIIFVIWSIIKVCLVHEPVIVILEIYFILILVIFPKKIAFFDFVIIIWKVIASVLLLLLLIVIIHSTILTWISELLSIRFIRIIPDIILGPRSTASVSRCNTWSASAFHSLSIIFIHQILFIHIIFTLILFIDIVVVHSPSIFLIFTITTAGRIENLTIIPLWNSNLGFLLVWISHDNTRWVILWRGIIDIGVDEII